MGTHSALAVALAMALSASASAAPKKKAAPAPAAAPAEDRLKRGEALLADGKLREALAELKGAVAGGAWQALFPLAQCERKLQKFTDAARDLASYLKQAPADRAAAAKKELDEIKAATAQVTVVAPASAEVSVDGEVMGLAPFDQPLLIGPGARLFLSAHDGKLNEKNVEVKAGTPITVSLMPVPPGFVAVTLDTSPAHARVKLDGKPVGTAPVALEVKAGDHVVEAEADGWLPLRQRFSWLEGKKQSVTLDLVAEADGSAPPSRRGGRFPLIGTLVSVVGLGAVGAGIGFGVISSGYASQVNALFQKGGTWDAYYDAQQAYGERANTSALALAVSGGLVLTTGVVMILIAILTSSDDEEQSLLLAPGPSGVGVRW